MTGGMTRIFPIGRDGFWVCPASPDNHFAATSMFRVFKGSPKNYELIEKLYAGTGHHFFIIDETLFLDDAQPASGWWLN